MNVGLKIELKKKITKKKSLLYTVQCCIFHLSLHCRTKTLGTYFQRDVSLNLPLDVEVTKISWIAVWDLSKEVLYMHPTVKFQLLRMNISHLCILWCCS